MVIYPYVPVQLCISQTEEIQCFLQVQYVATRWVIRNFPALFVSVMVVTLAACWEKVVCFAHKGGGAGMWQSPWPLISDNGRRSRRYDKDPPAYLILIMVLKMIMERCGGSFVVNLLKRTLHLLNTTIA